MVAGHDGTASKRHGRNVSFASTAGNGASHRLRLELTKGWLGSFPLYQTPHFWATYPFYFLGLLNYGNALGVGAWSPLERHNPA